MCDPSQGGAQSPMGSGGGGIQAPDMGSPSWMGGMPPTSSLGGSPAGPKKPGPSWQQRAMKIGRGVARGAMAGNQMQPAAPQQGMSYRPQMMSGQENESGPLSNGILDQYLRKQFAGQGITY